MYAYPINRGQGTILPTSSCTALMHAHSVHTCTHTHTHTHTHTSGTKDSLSHLKKQQENTTSEKPFTIAKRNAVFGHVYQKGNGPFLMRE